MEASAKTGINAKNVFVEAAKSLYFDYLKYKDKVDSVIIYNPQRSSSLYSGSGPIPLEIDPNIRLANSTTKKPEKKCAC